MKYNSYFACLIRSAVIAILLGNTATASADVSQSEIAKPKTASAASIDRRGFAQLFNPEIPPHFRGLWGMTPETCGNTAAGIMMTVQEHAITLADWSGSAWSLKVDEVAVAPGDPNNLLIDFKKADSRSDSDDFAPILKFVDFVKLTLSPNGQTLNVTQPSDQAFKSFPFHFCAALYSD